MGGAVWTAKDAKLIRADNKDSEQTEWMHMHTVSPEPMLFAHVGETSAKELDV